ncbi:leucine-rich repeat protein [Mycoplasma sp. Z244B]|uniref:leucine-rich repeat protein n=1 Tax=Mycoplasma sp. Z244B TaxID=3401659 RepID=UPI003AAE8821
MKRNKLFIIFSLASASSIITMPLVAGSCNNKNNENNSESNPIVTPAPNPGTTPEPGDTPKPTPIITPGSGKEQQDKEDNNTYSFLYSDGNKETNVKYYKNENRILIPDVQEITAQMLKYIFDNLTYKFNLIRNRDSFILECPNAKNICFDHWTGIAIKKIILPKVENVIYNKFENLYTTLLRSLEDDKVIQNGILFKWNNASGNIEDNSVKKIISGVFLNNEDITSVSFPNVTSIGDSAFYGATNLTSVSFPNATYIGSNAFENATGLTTVSFPNVTTIGKWAFYYATSLTSATMPKLKEVGWQAFECTPKLTSKIVANDKLVKWSGASGDIIDSSITSIAEGAFKNNQNITSVSFPNVTTIGESAFKGATGLTTVSFPNVITLGESAFYDAANLTSVNMPKLKDVGYGAFENTPKLINKPTEKWN